MANDKKEIQSLAEGMGANPLELLTLMGIAWAESAWRWDAVGDNHGSFGPFQNQRQDGVPKEKQVKDALDRIRKQNSYLAPIWNELAPYVDNSDVNVIRLHRANWQVGETRTRNWVDYIKTQISDIMSQSSVDEAGIRIALAGDDRKLDVNDFIAFMGTKGASVSALQGGQDLISHYINNEMPAITVAGATGWGMGLAIVIGIALFWFFKR